MFEFLNDLGNYAARKVARNDYDWGYISTAAVSDGRKPYETAVGHPDYNDGKLVIVDCYDTREEAAEGHKKWVATMTAEQLPAELKEACNSEIQQMIGEETFPCQRSKEA